MTEDERIIIVACAYATEALRRLPETSGQINADIANMIELEFNLTRTDTDDEEERFNVFNDARLRYAEAMGDPPEE